MAGRLITGRGWTIKRFANAIRSRGVRLIASRASSRAAVHGTKLPIPDILDKEKVEMEIRKGKEEKQRRRKEVENIVDSQLKNLQVLSDSHI